MANGRRPPIYARAGERGSALALEGESDVQATAEARTPPLAAIGLGAAGLLPFLAGLLGTLAPSLAIVGPEGLLGYGAVILSFLGGVHWGLAMMRGDAGWRALGASVVPSLVGWAALLAGGRAGLFGLAVAFAALLVYDLGEIRAGRAPGWYAALRWPLTAIVCLCTAVAGAAL